MRARSSVLALLGLACAEGQTPKHQPTPRPGVEVSVEREGEPVAVPSDPLLGFRWRDRPIHPQAITALARFWDRQVETVDLEAHPVSDDEVEVEGARVSFDDDEPGWDLYSVADREGERYLIEAGWSGGGSGRFTALIVVELRASTLTVMSRIGGGDRCNGGLTGDPRFEDGAVVVSHWITPFDLVAISSREGAGLEAYEDLEASAGSCIGFATVRVTGAGREELVGVTFAPGITGQWHDDQDGWTENYRLQGRFNEIYRTWVARGHTQLDRAGIDEFVAELLD